MKQLPSQFTRDGFDFRLIKRTGDVALFGKRKPKHRRDTFEVVIVQRHPAEVFCGYAYPARESMPVSETWGALGWSYCELGDAETKFRALVDSQREGHFQPAGILAEAFLSSDESPTAEGLL